MLDHQIIKRDDLLLSLNKSHEVIKDISFNIAVQKAILDAIRAVISCFSEGGKLIFAGNGGSAADAQHMSAEYVSRFMFDRPGLPSIAITTDTSALTAIGNDYSFDNLFSRQIQAIGNKGDVFFAYTTSGTSPNILKSLVEAKEKGIFTIGMTGAKPESVILDDLCDIVIRIPSVETPYIQEGHLVVGHLICLHVERLIFGEA